MIGMESTDSVAAVLISACLIDVHCRFDGASKHFAQFDAALKAGRLLPLCPEVAGGLGVPREPAHIIGGDGAAVLDGTATVRTSSGRDVTQEFVRGAQAVLTLARANQVKLAVLKQRSPSCGTGQLRSIEGDRFAGFGITAELLRRNGIEVISEDEWASWISKIR